MKSEIDDRKRSLNEPEPRLEWASRRSRVLCGLALAVVVGAILLEARPATAQGFGETLSNLLIRVSALENLIYTVGSDVNFFTGPDAGNRTMRGNNNTGVGANALFSNDRGDSNTAVGLFALRTNDTGSRNTALGASAMEKNITGNSNTAVGVVALFKNQGGSRNTALGAGALQNNLSGFNNTALGELALQSNAGGAFNIAVGSEALGNNTDGSFNLAVGDGALSRNTTGTSNTALGNGANVGADNLVNATAIGNGAVVATANSIRLGNTNIEHINAKVGIEIDSDVHLKENFLPLDEETTLKKMRHVRVHSWNFKGQDAKQLRHYGPNAQDFYAAFGHDGKGTIGTPRTINSTDMNGLLMASVQALEKRTTALKQENAALRRLLAEKDSQVANLSARLVALEQEMRTVNVPRAGPPR
jgi:hypothetical protein